MELRAYIVLLKRKYQIQKSDSIINHYQNIYYKAEQFKRLRNLLSEVLREEAAN